MRGSATAFAPPATTDADHERGLVVHAERAGQDPGEGTERADGERQQRDQPAGDGQPDALTEGDGDIHAEGSVRRHPAAAPGSVARGDRSAPG